MSNSSSVQPVLVLLGQPVAGNPTQFMMEKAFARHEMDWRYLSVEVAPEDLPDAVRGIRALGFRGGNCSDPHKQAILPLLDRLTESAQHSGTVNCIVREGRQLVGENTEGRAFVATLRRRAELAGKRVVLLGAGRLARAIAAELAPLKPAEIVVVNRSADRGRQLVQWLTNSLAVPASSVCWDDDYLLPIDTHVLISAIRCTPEDADAPLPIDLGLLGAGTVVADATFNPPRTWLVQQAVARGATPIDGMEIFLEQAAMNFRLWTGMDPDPTTLREAAEEYLEL